MNLDELLTFFVNKDYEELVSIAEVAVSRLIPPLERKLGEDDAYVALCVFVSSCVGADGTLTPNEKKLLKRVMGVDPDNAKTLVENAVDYRIANGLFDSVDEAIRKDLMMLCLACFAVDERINKDEIELLKHFLD